MDWMKQVGDVLDRYGDATPNRLPDTVDNDFDLFARRRRRRRFRGSLAAFRSDQTPEFPLMASSSSGGAPGPSGRGC